MIEKLVLDDGISFVGVLKLHYQVLHFTAYWDDQNTEHGYVHLLELRYYLADDTIEIKELQSEAGGEPGFMFLKRGKLPKRYCNK